MFGEGAPSGAGPAMQREPRSHDSPMLEIPPLLRDRLTPSPVAWMDWLCPQIDEAMLAEIAAADYGYRAEENLAALRRLRDNRRIPDRLEDVPLEVLELIRASEPDDPAWTPGRPGPRGHLLRLFCCAILLTAAGNAQLRQYIDAEPTLRQLTDSAVALGTAAIKAMLPLVCWCVPTLAPDDPDRPFFALSILLLAAALYRDEGDGPLLQQLCRWVIDEEARSRAALPAALLWAHWLFGLRFSADGNDRWRDLAWRLLIDPPAVLPEPAADALGDIGARLVLGAPDDPKRDR
jgi:hypothetical protein